MYMRFLVLVAFVPLLVSAQNVDVSGEGKTWHDTTLTLDGPEASESAEKPNPFLHYRMEVTFTHESGEPSYVVPGYFAADGNAAETSAAKGNRWRAHLSADNPGEWRYEIAFFTGNEPILDGGGDPLSPWHGLKGTFEIGESDKAAPDFRARGRLQYVGERYLKFAGDGSYFLKAGPDAPETFLAYKDFDGTRANSPKKGPLKSWQAHSQDWLEGDPTWQDEKGKGMIGALNYLAAKGLNGFSFLTYNAGGDGDNVWPFIEREKKLHYDCSKLDQWGIVFSHATSMGLHLHFKMQETEIDDNRHGQKGENKEVSTCLDGGKLGIERKLYIKELVARYAQNLALNWNIGEENTQSPEEVRAMAEFIKKLDPYDHPIVIHTFPNQQDKVYPKLLGEASSLTGASLQNHWNEVHKRTLQWVRASAEAGKAWVVANDEQGPANLGVPPDPGYQGFSGKAKAGNESKSYDLNDIRRETLWGNLMAGGAGVEYYFGYQLPENDLVAEDYHSRDKSWEYCHIALSLFHENEIPFWEMEPADEEVGNPNGISGKPWCLAKSGSCYLVFLPKGEPEFELNPEGELNDYQPRWFDPIQGEWLDLEVELKSSTVERPESHEDDLLFWLTK